MDYDVISFGHDGFLLARIDEGDLHIIKEDIFKIQNNFDTSVKITDILAGNLQREYRLSSNSVSKLHEIVFPYIDEYNKHFSYAQEIIFLDNNLPFSLDEPWVNFQKKYEFNPLHRHAGVFSFVLWIQIPYINENELITPSVINSNNKRAGNFEFVYTSTLGQVKTHPIPADKRMENCMIIFPSTMMHCVYPFYTSDDYRISIAGNYLLTTKYLQ